MSLRSARAELTRCVGILKSGERCTHRGYYADDGKWRCKQHPREIVAVPGAKRKPRVALSASEKAAKERAEAKAAREAEEAAQRATEERRSKATKAELRDEIEELEGKLKEKIDAVEELEKDISKDREDYAIAYNSYEHAVWAIDSCVVHLRKLIDMLASGPRCDESIELHDARMALHDAEEALEDIEEPPQPEK